MVQNFFETCALNMAIIRAVAENNANEAATQYRVATA